MEKWGADDRKIVVLQGCERNRIIVCIKSAGGGLQMQRCSTGALLSFSACGGEIQVIPRSARDGR